MGTPSDTVTSAEAAKLMGVHPRRVRQLKEAIGYARVGFLLTFSRGAVVDFARANGYAPGPAGTKPRSKRKRKKVKT